MESINNLSIKNSLFYVFFICLCLTIIPAVELSAAEKDDTSDKIGTDASYTSDTIEKMVVEDKGTEVITNRTNVTGRKPVKPTPVNTKVHSPSTGDATKIGAPPKNGNKPNHFKSGESTPEAIEANSRRIRKGIESNPNNTIYTHGDIDLVKLGNPGKTVKQIAPPSDQKKGWYKTESQTKTGQVKKKDRYHPGITDAEATEQLKQLVKKTGDMKRANSSPTAQQDLPKVKNNAIDDIPQPKQQKISSGVQGGGDVKTKVYGQDIKTSPGRVNVGNDVKTKVYGQDIVPATNTPKGNANIPSGTKTKVFDGPGDVADLLEIGARGVNNYAKTKGESIDKGHEELTSGETVKVIRETLPIVSDYEKSYEVSKAFQEKRRLESIRRQETITRLKNKKNLTSDEEAELSKAEIWKEYNQEDVEGSLERRKRQHQLAEKLSDGSITPEQVEEMERLGNEEFEQRLRDAKNDTAEAVNNVAEGYEANMMERFNAEKEKAQNEGREFRENPDFYNDGLPMAGEMLKDAIHAINPLNQITTPLKEAEIEFSTHDERRAWAAMKEEMTTKLNSQASEIDKRTLANNTKLSQLLTGQDLTDPEVQDNINALLDEMQQDRDKLGELNAIADDKLQEVDPEKLETLRNLDKSLPDVWAVAGWSYELIGEQVKERDKKQKEKLNKDLVEMGDALLENLRNAEYIEDSNNPQEYMANNTGSYNNVQIPPTSAWQASATDVTANERTNNANAANAEAQLENQTQQQTAAYQAQQTANQHQTAESLNQIERNQSTQLLDAVLGGVTSGIAQGVGTFGERVGQAAGVKASQNIMGNRHNSGGNKHSSDTSVSTTSPPPNRPSQEGTSTTHKPPTNTKHTQSADGCAGGRCCSGHQLYCKPLYSKGASESSYPRTSLDRNTDWVCDICGRPFKTKQGRLAPGLRGAQRGDVSCRH